MPNDAMPRRDDDTTQVIPLGLSWLLVGVPALWGIWQVVVKSLSLFRR